MPVDMFPPINIPVVLVATFYNGMPPEQIEADITDTFERFFTLGSGIDHMESRSMTGVSLIKIYFQPGTDANADVTNISNLAMADLRRLPEGTLPPVVMKVDASSLPVCLLTVDGQGLNETQLHDYLQFQIRNQIAGVPGATVPPPYGGKYRQIMVYVDPLKLQAHALSPMDVVRAMNESNLILPAGDVRRGLFLAQAEGMKKLLSRVLKCVRAKQANSSRARTGVLEGDGHNVRETKRLPVMGDQLRNPRRGNHSRHPGRRTCVHGFARPAQGGAAQYKFAQTAQRQDQTAQRGRRYLSQRGRHHPPHRCRARRTELRMGRPGMHRPTWR